MIITIKDIFKNDEELIEQLEKIYIDCPECYIIEDEQYQCTTCESTNSKISFFEFINTPIYEEEYETFIDGISGIDNILLWDMEDYDEEYEYSGIPIFDIIEIKE